MTDVAIKREIIDSWKSRSYRFQFLRHGGTIKVEIRQNGWETHMFTAEEIEIEILELNHRSNNGEIALVDVADRRYVLNAALRALGE